MKVVFTKQSGILLLAVLACFFGTLNAFGVGGVDTSFIGTASTAGAGITDAAVQADGKIIVAGDFSVINSVVRTRVARFNTDGTVDLTFNPPELSVGGLFTGVAVQPDGKIIVAGGFSVVNSTRKNVIRLYPNGSIDESFSDNSGLNWTSSVFIEKVIIRPDGKILISGRSITINGSSRSMFRLNANGSFDSSFVFGESRGAWDADLLPDGKILAATENNTSRYLSDGARDTAFPSPSVNGGNSSVKIVTTEALPDGNVLIGGDFTSVNGTPQQGEIARIKPDGTVDTTFNAGGTGADRRLYDISTTSEGKIYISGELTQYNGTARSRLARLTADGSLDPSFTYVPPTTNSYVEKTLPLSDGRVLIMGQNVGGKNVSMIRLNADGTPDPTFQGYAGTGGSVRDMIRQPDGKYIIGGGFEIVNGLVRRHIARLNADGSVDPTFNCTLFDGIFANVTRVAVQTDGKVVFTLQDYPGSIRLNADGSLDSTYVPPPIVSAYDVDLFPNGQILVGGAYKLNPNGSVDTSFSPPNQASLATLVFGAVVQTDGKIMIGGSFGNIGNSRGNVARLNANGSVDPTFAPPSGANNKVVDLDVQADGKVVIAGDFTSVNGNTARKYVARLNADGSLDTSFAPNISVPQFTLPTMASVKVQPDGKILIAGNLTAVNGIPRKGYARLNADGSLDTSFNFGTGANGMVWRIGLDTDNKVLIGGDFTKVAGFATSGVARLEPATLKAAFDYDGDGRADVSVFRPSENKWFILRSSDLSIYQPTFAVAGDIPVPADYDGDGKTDVAIFRPSTGQWWYLSSINNAQIAVNWGASGDVPMPSDIDGDGKTDFVYFRPSNSTWYRLTNGTAIQSQIVFGATGDKPLIGDFDGDDKSDPAIFRPSTGDWWYRSSITGQFITVHWGATGDYAVPGDYDADGKTDFVVFRPSDGGWYILYSTGSYTIATFGTVGDKPIAADYDGDGKTDIAVFRPSTGVWYLLQTTSGFGAVNWGNASDIPTENAFIP